VEVPPGHDDPSDPAGGQAMRRRARSEWREQLFRAVPKLIVADVVMLRCTP